MLTRLLTGIVLVILLVPVIIFYDTIALPLVFALIAVVSLYEMAKCVGIADKKFLPLTIIAYAIAVLLPILQYLAPASGLTYTLAVASVAVYVVYALSVFDVIRPMSRIPQFVSMIVYIGGAVVSVTATASLPNGGFIVPLIFLGSWLTDTFAYLCGTLFGRHKLIPKVSPKKTVEGSVGAVIFTLAAFALYGYIVGAVTDLTVNYLPLMLTGLALSVISQIGDLNASCIKRAYGVKDYGNIFPGHGGMLDRFDSVMAVSPILYLAASIFTYFI